MQRIKLITKIGGKALPRLGGNGKIPGGIPHLRHHRDDGLDTDGTGELAKTVKSIPLTAENWLRKLYNYSVNDDTSTEDKHETNHINNEYNNMNMNTRKMHNT